MSFDLLIKNARIIDGTGNPWYRGDVGVIGDQITAIGNLANADATKVIDAGGKILSPGFIDMHTHSDLMVFVEPDLPAKVMQGITTDFLTQDGISVAPVSEETKPVWRKGLAGLNGDPPIEWTWNTLGEYMDALERVQPGINLVTVVPFGNVRSLVLGFEAVKPNADQLEQMKAIVRQGMEEGACGMSLGLIYQPQMYADQDELAEVFKPVGEFGGSMVVHMRNESDLLLEAVDEVVEVCLRAGCHLHISHLKAGGKRNWEKGPLLVQKMEEARARGLEVTFDQYPYTYGSTFFQAILPPWATEGGVEKIITRLKDPETRNLIALQMETMAGTDRPTEDPTLQFWENIVDSSGWDGIRITAVRSEQNRHMEGRNVAEIAGALGKSPADVAFDLLIEEECSVSMAIQMGSEENVERFLAHEFGTIGTDGLLIGKMHPRAYGSFPRILGQYVREKGILSLPQMVRRMTSAAAQRLGLQDSGLVKTGMKADLVLFDPDTVADAATFANPRQYSSGIHSVVVNGALAVEDGKLTGNRAGKVLRRGR